MKKLIFFFTSLIVVLPLNIFAQGQYLFQKYPPEVYKLNPQVWSISLDSTGLMYFGTTAGIVTYDGVRWQSHIPFKKHSAIIRALNYDVKKKKMLFSGDDYFGWLKQDSVGNLDYEYISDQFQFETPLSNVLYINQIDSAVFYQDIKQTFTYSNNKISSFLNGRKINKSFEFKGELWIRDYIGGYGYFKKNTDSLIYVDSKDHFIGRSVYIQIPFQNKLYFFPANESVKYWDGSKINKLSGALNDSLRLHTVYRANVMNDTLLALGTLSAGVFIINKNHEMVTHLTEKNGLLTNVVYELFYDRNQLWVGQDQGITRFQIPSSIVQLTENEGLSGIITAISSNNETVYVGTSLGLYEINGELNSSVKKVSGIDRVYDILNLNSECSKVLVSTIQGVFQKENNTWQKIKTEQIQHLELLEKNLMVWATNQEWGICDSEFKKQRFTKKIRHALRLVYTSAQKLYFVYLDGTIEKINTKTAEVDWIFNVDSFTRVKNPNEIVLLENELLIGFQNGFLALDNSTGKPVKKSAFESLKSVGSVFHFFLENEKQLWVQGHHNLLRFTKKETNWIIESIPFTQVAYDQAVNGIVRNKNGLWLSTTKNLWRFDPENLPAPIPFSTRIAEIRLKNDSLYRVGFGGFPEENIFSYQNNELRIRFAAPIFWDESRTQYRYKLLGESDENWSQWSTESQKDYTNLFEGEYSFIVEAKDAYEVIGKQAEFHFSILPPWYRTWWAFSLYLIAVGFTFYGIYSWRITQIMKEVNLRNKIAGDLHDEVSATLSSISFFVKALSLNKPDHEKQRFVDLIAESALDAKEKITDIVWAVNPEHDNWEAFLSKIKRYSADIFESAGIKFNLTIPEKIDAKLQMNHRHQLWLIIKEIITNIVRHANCTHVSVRLQLNQERILLTVQDNGKGIPENKMKGNNGLKNIQKRTKTLNGSATLSSDSTFGTRWDIQVPLE